MMRILILFCAASMSFAHAAEPSNVQQAIDTIHNVQREGQGNAEAQTAWKTLVEAGPQAVLPILKNVRSNTFQAAWFDSVLTAIAEQPGQLPIKEIRGFLNDQSNDTLARFFAYGLLKQAEPEATKMMLRGMIDDPNALIRTEAIALRMEQLPDDRAERTAELKQLFDAVRDFEQAKTLAKELKQVDVATDLPRHFGIVTQWHLIGPFDSTDGKGFGQAFPPEAGVDLKGTYKGKSNDVTWKPFQSSGDNGKVDLNKALGKNMDAAGYAYAVLLSTKDQPAEIRVASQNAIEIFLNGEKVFEREEYHHGTRMDQHIAKVTLREGTNKLLIKVLQNNQPQSWTQNWDFLLRVSDSTGGRLPLLQMIETEAGPQTVELSQLRSDEPKEKK